MIQADNLTDDNFMLYAMHNYQNPSCNSMKEFQEDLNRIRYIKRLFNKYYKTGKLKERLILNHIVVFYNMFGREASTRMIFLKIDENFHSYLKTFLSYLDLMPITIRLVNSRNILDCNLPIEENIQNVLSKL